MGWNSGSPSLAALINSPAEGLRIAGGLAFVAIRLTILEMTSLTIKLPDAMKAQLEKDARLSGKSVSALVRGALESRMRQGGKPGLSLFERSRHLCGSIRSAVSDLATNPKHLEGFGEWRR